MGLSAFPARSRIAASYVLPSAGNSGRNGRGLIVGCSAVPNSDIGIRPGNKSSGMAASTP